MSKKTSSKSEKIFYTVAQSEWEKLRKTKDTLFENIEYKPEFKTSFDKFKSSPEYFEFLTENSDYNRQKIIHRWFYENTIFPIVESVIESTDPESVSITGEVLLENTFLEVQNKYAITKDDKILEYNRKIGEMIVESLELHVIQLKDQGLIEEAELIEEGILNSIRNTGDKMSEIWNFLSQNTKASYEILGLMWNIIAYGVIDNSINAFQVIARINKEQPEFVKIFKKYTFPENDNIKEFLKTYGQTSIDSLVQECWKQQTRYIINQSKSNQPMVVEAVRNFGKILHEFFSNKILLGNIRNVPRSSTRYLSRLTLEERQAIDKFRMCFYYKLMDYVASLAIASFDLGKVSSDLIKRMEELPRADATKAAYVYKDIYNLRNANQAEEIFREALIILATINLIISKAEKDLSKNQEGYYLYTSKDSLLKIKNRLKQTIDEVSDSYRRIKSSPKPKRYEENYRQNQEKTIQGNTPEKPKKESLFDI